MKKIELEELKEIGRGFSYEIEEKSSSQELNPNEILEQSKKIAASFNYNENSPTTLQEETYDDFDTAYESLRTGLEQELRNYTINLLANNAANFTWSFVEPTTQTFADVWDFILTRFTVADDALRDQFLNRVKILLRNIFIEKFNISDEEKAFQLADAYFLVFKVAINQLLDKMKPKEGQSTDTAQDWRDESDREIEYK